MNVDYDLVSQLRNPYHYDLLSFDVLLDDAANEIERLRKQTAELQVQKAIWREMCEEAQQQLQKALEQSYRLDDDRG